MPASTLEGLPLPTLRAYEAYSSQFGMPIERVELQLARICMLLDSIRQGPGARLSLRDYLIGVSHDFAPETEADEVNQDGAAHDLTTAAFGFNPPKKRAV